MKTNIVTVWTWFANILDTSSLSASEQLILVHLIKIFNRNFWKPTKISIAAICRSCGKDSRTVKRSISLLKNANLITESKDGELFLNLGSRETEEKPKRQTRQKKPDPLTQKTPSQNSDKGFFSAMVLSLADDLQKNGKLDDKAKAIFDNLSELEKSQINWLSKQQKLEL